ncbi:MULTISPECIES: DUF7446 family protein [Mycobacterium avium complex (MAC)]|uniref:Uncharacterized protein n=1 Tax=Mycobacterium intracellulare subsp. chimaera TaxID=222805 RepID=A0ABT7P378_MYCIT|nr:MULTISPECIES: hypothetical protein [Mycobacterium avium complex (MAC)]AOS94818.1 hypothetical protein AN480_27410 [Mycobacterium intracellulare subsp. chimaera]MDM3927742.1 hypothetical protein [Mycobacterium intracellulare subsp. chimaera]PBA68862.1 hypothetical protein CKJ76_25920 [Mycobacterium avium]
MYFGLQEGWHSGKINVGLLDRKQTMFLGGEDLVDIDGGTSELMPGMDDYLAGLHHEDCTDMAIRVVAEHITKHYDGSLVIDYKDGTKYEIQVTKATAGPPKPE